MDERHDLQRVEPNERRRGQQRSARRPVPRSARELKALLAVSSLAVTLGGWVGLSLLDQPASTPGATPAGATLPVVEIGALPSPVVVQASPTPDSGVSSAAASPATRSVPPPSGNQQLRTVTVPRQAPAARTRSSR